MKVKLILTSKPSPLEVTMKGHPEDPSFQALKQHLENHQKLAIAKKDNETYRIPFLDIYFIESQEEKTLLFTKTDSFMSNLRLFEIEQWGNPFIRVSKTTIINLQYLQSVKPLLNSKLEATLVNGDRIEISRHYLQALKETLKGDAR
jgi:DNA-binding LytR/AlgR family response regulator